MSTPDIAPTVVLVHGAFVDASSWTGVIAELNAAGIDVVAPPNLLRGVGVDAAYLAGFVAALGRPVVLVGHSYAGEPELDVLEQRLAAFPAITVPTITLEGDAN